MVSYKGKGEFENTFLKKVSIPERKQISSRLRNICSQDKMDGACRTYGRDDTRIQGLRRVNRKERDNLEDPYTDGRIFNIMGW